MARAKGVNRVAVAVTRLQWALEHKETPDGAGIAQCTADLMRAVVREEIEHAKT